MSTFSGISTALSSLIAQRQGLEVSGQNIANANTVGYTRQRANLAPIGSASVPSMFSTSKGVGQGVFVTDIQRLGDVFADARLRTETAGSAQLGQIATAFSQLEDTVGEPDANKNGLSDQLSDMWSAWGDVSTTPDTDASKAVLLERSQAVADRIATLYRGADTQWTQARTSAASMVDQVNTTATNIADLNDRILAITNSGGSANELMDQRDQLITSLSDLVGATVRTHDDGQVDVLVAGNTLVSGSSAKQIALAGPTSFAGAMQDVDPANPLSSTETVVWAGSGTPVGLQTGRIAGLMTTLAPRDGGNGGLITEAAASYNALATQVATVVNALHTTGYTTAGVQGGDFFTFTAGSPPALGLTVAITDPADIAAAGAGLGANDGSVATKLAALATSSTGPDASWSAFVTQLGVKSASATSRATVAEAARSTAEAQQLSQTSVDTDQETVDMMSYQRAYEGAARVLTAIDEMLDTLINRTGVVGR